MLSDKQPQTSRYSVKITIQNHYYFHFFYLTVLFYHSFFRMGLIPPKENLGMTGVSFYRLDTFLSYNLQCQSTEWQITINSFVANVDKS